MTWKDLGTWFLGFFLPTITIAIPIYMKLVKQIGEKRKVQGQQGIDSFNSILEANRALRDELDRDKKELRVELQKEKEVVARLAKTIIAHASKIEQISFQNRILQKHLRNILGMKNIINITTIKIAVLEDNNSDTILLGHLLARNGIENVSFYSNAEGFLKSIDSDVRIVIVDHKLNGGVITGLDVIKQLIDTDEYRYFIMLSGIEDFNIIYNFNRLVMHGLYVLKGRPESDSLIIKTIRNTVYYLNMLSDAYNEINALRNDEEPPIHL